MSGLGSVKRLITCLIGWGVVFLIAPTAGLAQLAEPVDGEVVDRYRPPAHIGAPGNRGWEYATEPGSAAMAAAPGVVVFAGSVGDGRYVSIDHGAGLRTTYSLLASVAVTAGERVATGTPVGTTGSVFHFGVRRNGTYVDPATLLGSARDHVRLVPRPHAGVSNASHALFTDWVPRVWRASGASPAGDGVSVSTGQHYTRLLARFRVR